MSERTAYIVMLVSLLVFWFLFVFTKECLCIFFGYRIVQVLYFL